MGKTEEPKYPECEKLSGVAEKKVEICAFLEWAEQNNLHLCVFDPKANFDNYMRTPESVEKIIHRFYGIDDKKLEEERRAMLKRQRHLNEED